MPEVTVNIYSRAYRLAVSTGEEALLQRCAEIVDRQMRNIREGGKVIIKEETAPYRDKINVEIQADSGYKLDQVHFYKVRPDGSRSELTRHKKVTGQSYWFEMPSFKVEVEADFIKY